MGDAAGELEFVRLTDEAAVLGDRAVVRHGDTGLLRGLEPGEEVVVLDLDGEFRSAHVVDLEFSLDDTHYVLALGGRLPEDVAQGRVRGERAPVDDVVDLLGQLRGRVRRPADAD